MLRIAVVNGYRRGEVLFGPDDVPDRIYLLQVGWVKTYQLSLQGNEKILHVFSPGDAFGGLLLGVAGDKLPWAQALDDVIVITMDGPAFKQFMQRCPDSCLNLFKYMAAHHAADMRRLESFIHTKASHRLVQTLFDLGHQHHHDDHDQFEIASCFTQQTLADMIGVVRSTVSELLSELRQAGVVSNRGRRLIVHRQAALEYLREA